MKIGILTFHSQQNYGGVLQCFALKAALEAMGHEVVIVDRWLNPERRQLLGVLSGSWIFVLRYLIAVLRRRQPLAPLIRAVRSIRFVKGLGVTPYHFVDWKDAPQDLGVDCLVVGSDQVWHCGDFGDPTAYLLEGADGKVPRAISYAASFGLKEIPAEFRELYGRGLKRFAAISCREKEGVELCRGLGYEATHVVDPTLLADSSRWNKLLKTNHHRSTFHLPPPTSSLTSDLQPPHEHKLVCYFMSVNLAEALPHLEAFAESQGARVEVVVDHPFTGVRPKSSRVKIVASYGPKEFVRAFASATWTLADSFHAVMFSTIFNTNLRFIRPQSEMRRAMFARIEEFAEKCITGPVFVDSVKAALDSFACGEAIEYNQAEIESRRAASAEWLREKVGG